VKSFVTVFFCILIQISFSQPPKFSPEKISQKKFLDSVKISRNFGLISIPCIVGINSIDFLFDSGADMMVHADSLIRTNVRIKVSENNAAKKYYMGIIKEISISSVGFENIKTISTTLPKPFTCIADGVLGNNIISKCNWWIKDSNLLISNKSFKARGIKPLKFRYASFFRIFSDIKINSIPLDSCLIDYGGRYEIQLPLDKLKDFKDKPSNFFVKKLSSTWTLNGKSSIDTVYLLNCNVEFCGHRLDSVNFEFSRSRREKRIGALLLNRFSSTILNGKSRQIYFISLAKTRPAQSLPAPISFDLENEHFVIDGKLISEGTQKVSVLEEFDSINGKSPSDFRTYCDFLVWQRYLRATSQFILRSKFGEVSIGNWLKTGSYLKNTDKQ
jgi:hypothetical protein